MHYDVVIIGAGMSGLAAGIRLAYFDKSVCILEKHYAYGGLNSYYRLDGREFDVGLHALTNFADSKQRNAPLNRVLRQLRIPRDALDLHPQGFSEVRFPEHRLRFTNDIAVLTEEVAVQFPSQADGFRRLVGAVKAFDDTRLDMPYVSARRMLGEYLDETVLIDMLLCPLLYYGSPQPHDMAWQHFVILFRSIYCEGLARPRDGVRTIIKALVRQFRACGGSLRMRCGVERIEVERGRVAGLVLESGETITADTVISSAGYFETMRLCSEWREEVPDDHIGRLSFVESIAILGERPAKLGHEATLVFFNDGPRFVYDVPEDLVDLRSGVVCCPNNYEGHEDLAEGVFRVTWLANYQRWTALSEDEYRAAKAALMDRFVEQASRYMPEVAGHIVFTDMFTPRTIEHYTGHIHGAVYGMPRKQWDGRTHLENLFICGTDQGYLGIVGAMVSGSMMANIHVLGRG